MLAEAPAGHRVAAAQGARAVRARAEQLAARAPGADRRSREGRGSNPDLQRKAIQYLGVNGRRRESRRCWPRSTRRPPTSTSSARSCAPTWSPAIGPACSPPPPARSSPELRQEAVRQLGVMGAREELWQLYQKETRRRGQAPDPAGALRRRRRDAPDRARQHRDRTPSCGRRAVRHLGTMGRTETGDALVGLYAEGEGRRHQAHRHQRAVRAGQRRVAGRHRPQGNRSGDEARDGVRSCR